MHPSHGALQSPAEVLFLDRQGEKRIAGTPRLPFARQAGGKGTRKRTPCSHDCRFLDRQGGKGIASTSHVPMIAFSSTGRGERPSQTRTKSMIWPFPRLAGGKGYHNRTNSNRESHISRAPRENSSVLTGLGAVRRLGSPRGAFEVPGGDLRRPFLDRQKEKAITSAQTLIENVIFRVPVDEKRHFGLSRVIPRRLKPCRAPRSPSGPCRAPCAPQPRSPAESRGSPFPRQARGKANRRHPMTAFSSTGRGKSDSQPSSVGQRRHEQAGTNQAGMNKQTPNRVRWSEAPCAL